MVIQIYLQMENNWYNVYYKKDDLLKLRNFENNKNINIKALNNDKVSKVSIVVYVVFTSDYLQNVQSITAGI